MSSKFTDKLSDFLKVIICLPFFGVYLIYCYILALFESILPSSSKSLEGETILVTGASSGIGRAIALKLSTAYEKITLILWDYNDIALQQTASDARALGVKVHAYCVDVSNHLKVSEAAQKVRNDAGDVTVLINNAGVSHNRGIFKLTPEQIERTIKINCLAHFWTIREFLPKMIEKNHGHISATCSLGGLFALRGNIPYFASKFAIRGAMMALKDEIRQDYPDKLGVHFTTIYPWFVSTPLLDKLNIRFRFPRLMQLVEPDYLADKTIEGICKNQEHVIAPSKFGLNVWLESVVPEPLRKKIRDFGILEYRGTEDDDDMKPTEKIEINKDM